MAKTPGASASARKKTPAKKSKATPKSSGGSRTASSSKKSKTPRTQTKTKSPKVTVQDPITSSKTILYEDDTKQFHSHVQCIPRRDKFMKSDPMSKPTFNQHNENDTWRVSIGDLACIENSNADNEKKKYPPGKTKVAAPFTAVWRPCQILSLFRQRVKKKLATKKCWGPLKMEVRWFYRTADLDDRNRHYEKPPKKKGGSSNSSGKMHGEVFETNHVAVLEASLLLGRLVLKHDHHDKAGNNFLEYPIPTVVNPCYRYYLHEEQDVFEVYDYEESILTRGLECSKMLQHEAVRKAAYKYLGLSPSRRCGGGEMGHDSMVLLPPPAKTIQYKEECNTFYASCTLTHPWSQFTHSNLLCPPAKRDSFPKWQLCVGDIVAVHCDDGATPSSDADAIPGRDEWYPYRVPWSHCQVTAIYSSIESSSVPASMLFCEIRWFPRVSEAQAMCQDKKTVLERLKQISNDVERMSEEILEGVQLSNIDCGSLLGPVFIDEDSNPQDENLSPRFLPRNRRTISDSIGCDVKGTPVVRRGAIDLDPTLRVHRGFDASRRFKNDNQRAPIMSAVLRSRKERAEQMLRSEKPQAEMESKSVEVETGEALAGDIAAEPIGCKRSPHKKRQLFGGDSNGKAESKRCRSLVLVENAPQDALMSESVAESDHPPNDAMDEEHTTILHEARVSCCTDPFHVDVSALKSFYEEVEIVPPVDSYDNRYSTGVGGANQCTGKWNLKLGDTVTIEVEQNSKDSSAVYFPFVVPWAPAEIVSIYRVHETKEACARLRENLSKKVQHDKDTSQDEGTGDIMIEVRWFYRPYEIPGASKKKSESVDNGELDEVFETDQIDVCSADSILSPIQLHDVSKPLNAPCAILGMPCINYFCSRLWSIHRRSFVPSGSLNNRVSRGRMHSAYKAALSKLHRLPSAVSTSPFNQRNVKSWKESFQTAIQQLSLAEAAQDAQENGVVLACREKERDQIKSFLNTAICGLVTTNKADGQKDETMNLTSSMFIAGPPGTGKTATVRSIIAELQTEQYDGSLPEFNFIALNGMELRHPFDAYVKFWEALSGTRKEKLPAGEAANRLEKYFCGDQFHETDEEIKKANMSERPVTVLMLDEIDYIVTSKETLIYNFFDWPLRATTARLVVIGISNTIHLPEQLQPKMQSRIGGNRVHFRSYNVQDTITILKTRLGMLDDHPGYLVFEEDAIKATRKTANLSGDIRKAFHMCKAAAESVLEDHTSGKKQMTRGAQPVVRISDVQKGSRDMFTSIVHMAVKCSTTYEALLLISLGAIKRIRDDPHFTVREILTKIESIANSSGEPRYMNARLSFSDVLGMLNRLGGAGIVQLTSYLSSPWPLVSTHLHNYEILACYRDTPHSKLAEKHLARDKLF
ncbi:hypothetical protein ACHAXR_013332 [Thalassiosira sp. AJA248-18]